MSHRAGGIVILCGTFALGLGPATAVRGQESPPTPRVLFDGKTLDGWKKTDFSRAGQVRVADGAIVLEKGDSMTGVTTTLGDLPKVDYELTYEAQRRKGGDFFAAATFPVRDSHITLVNGGWGGSVTGLSSLNGADASENDSSTFVKYENNTWYRFRVRVTAKRIVCWVDDKVVVSVDIVDRPVSTRLETYANKPLGFATWETTGAIRKVEIRPLTAAEVAETERTEKP